MVDTIYYISYWSLFGIWSVNCKYNKFIMTREEEIKPLNAIEYANWIEGYKSKIESKYFELFKKAREEDKQELINKACGWLEQHQESYDMYDAWTGDYVNFKSLIIDFREAMEDLK